MTNLVGLLPSVAFRLAERQGEAGFERFSNRRDVQQDLDRRLNAIRRLRSVDDLFRNQTALEFVAISTGTTGELQLPTRFKRALLSDIRDPNALINRINNPALTETYNQLQLRDTGLTTLRQQATLDDLSDSYLRTRYEQDLSAGSEEVSQARYFQRNIAQASDNVFKILSDPILRDVIYNTLGFPQQIFFQEVEQQARTIERSIDIRRFSDRKFTDRFIQRFLNTADQRQQAASGGSIDSQLAGLLQPITLPGSDPNARTQTNRFGFNILA